MNKIIIGCLLCLVYSYTNAQQVIIKDSETGVLLEGVTLVSITPSAMTTSDKKGRADISLFKGAEEIQIRSLGYKTELKSYADIARNGFEIELLLTGVPLDELVISASKFEERQDDVVQKIQVMRSSELKAMNQSSMADVLAASGNIMVQKSQQGGGSPVIRGFEANKVLIVVDGVRMNNAIYRGGHLQNVITLDNAVMDRVELVFGPGSVVYGSDALGGVMHFYSKNPSLSKGDSLLVKTNAYTRYFSAASGFAGHADISLAKEKFGSFTSFTYSNFGDLRQGAVRNPFYGNFGSRPWFVDRINGIDSVLVNRDSNRQVYSGYQQYDLLQKFMLKTSNKVSHTLNFQFSTSSDVPRYDRLTQESGGKPRYAQWYYGPQKRLFSTYNMALSGRTRMYDHARIIFGYQHIEESRNTRRFKNELLEQRIEKLDIVSLNADLDKLIADHELRYGIEVTYNKVNSKAFTTQINTGEIGALDTRYPDNGSSMYSIAVYATHTWEINEKLILNDGLRISNIGLTSDFSNKEFFPFPFDKIKQNNSSINGNIGLIAKTCSGCRLTLNFSTGFRAPNVDDMGKVFESVPGSVILPNPDLKPEYTYNAELGFSKTFNKQVTLSATGYYTLYKNALTVAPALFEGQDSIFFDGQLSRVTSTINAGEAYIAGAEGRVAGNLNEFLSITGSVNYTYGRIKTDSTDSPLDHIPPVFGKLSFNVVKGNFRGEFFTNFSGWKRLKDYNLNGEDNFSNATEFGMPAWYTLNARLSYQLIRSLNLQVACENILDSNYRVFASNISAPGRNFIITLRGSF